MTNYPTRKMGFLEKFATVVHDRLAGSNSVAIIIKVNGAIEFGLFKQAWEILFQRQPMLRAVKRVAGDEYFFDFSARFVDIPIKHITTNNDVDVEQEYSRDSLKAFDLSRYFWRTTLISMSNSNDSHIVFAASHTIVDGISMSWLLGDLLRIIIQLKSGQKPDTVSLPIPLTIDDILDRDKFSPPQKELVPRAGPLRFHHPATVSNARSENVLRSLSPATLERLLATCRQQQTTLTNMLSAAFALSMYDIESKTEGFFDLWIAVNLRAFAKQLVPSRLLAFYAYQVLCDLEITAKQDVWELAKQAEIKYQQAIQEYVHPAANDDPKILEDFFVAWDKNISEQRFLFSYLITNMGVIDQAFAGVENHYHVESCYCALSQQAMPYGLIIAVTTINGKLCLDFNFASPAIEKAFVERVADRMLTYLIS